MKYICRPGPIYIWAWGLIILLLLACTGFLPKKEAAWKLPPLFGKVIVIDPGHGGIDSGTHDGQGLMEKDLNLELAHRLRRALREEGAFVVMTREGDHELSYMSNKYKSRHQRDLNSRILITERSQAELMLSLHINASSAAYCQGGMVFYQPSSEKSKKLAHLIQEEMAKIAPWHDNTPLAGRVYYILRNSPATTVLIETGFLTNPQEKELLCQEEYQEKIISAVAAAVLRFYQE